MQFTTVPSPKMSARYVHVDTNKFIDAMREEGFKVVDTKADRVTKRDPAFARHQVIFEHDSQDIRADVRPRVLFMNSANGTSRATVGMGLIRWACFNGLIVGDNMQVESTRHIGDTARELIERAKRMAKNTTPLFAKIEQWEQRELSEAAARAFAERAAVLRWGEEHALSYNVADLLVPRRAEDDSMSLWAVFNRVQENATHGGFAGRASTGRRIVARRLTGITMDTKFNQGLWALADAV